MPTHCFKGIVEDNSLVEQVKKWYELESNGTYKSADPRSASDKQARKTLESTILHEGTRYSVGMLWIDKDVRLPNNYYFAFAQLEKRFEKDPELKNLNGQIFQDHLELG